MHNIDHEFEQRERESRPKRKDVIEQRVRAERMRERREYQRARRVVDMTRLYRARYCHKLPDNAAGRRALEAMAHHIKATDKIRLWCELWAPWLTAVELDGILFDVVAHPQTWKADALAAYLGVTDAERERLHMRTIRACDVTAEQYRARRRERQRKCQQRLRQARGATPRAESASRTKPWEAFGISRRTWERRGKPMPPKAVTQVRRQYESFAFIYRPRTCDSGSAALVAVSGVVSAGELDPLAAVPIGGSERPEPGRCLPAWREPQGVFADGDHALRTRCLPPIDFGGCGRTGRVAGYSSPIGF